MTTPDIAGLCERLRTPAMVIDPRGAATSIYRPSNALEIADTLERQAAEIERLRGALTGLLGFVGQLSPAEFVSALYWHNTPGLELTTREELEANLNAAVAAGFAALATRAALTGEDA
jgi:hypothetical protein